MVSYFLFIFFAEEYMQKKWTIIKWSIFLILWGGVFSLPNTFTNYIPLFSGILIICTGVFFFFSVTSVSRKTLLYLLWISTIILFISSIIVWNESNISFTLFSLLWTFCLAGIGCFIAHILKIFDNTVGKFVDSSSSTEQ